MAKYLFTISHEAASKAELVEVLKCLQIEFTEIIKNNNYVILDIEKFDPKSLNIGGIYKISEILFEADSKDEIVDQIIENKMFEWFPEKSKWSLSTYFQNVEIHKEFERDLKEIIKINKIKKTKYIPPNIVKDNLIELHSDKLNEKITDFTVIQFDGHYYFGRTISMFNIRKISFYDLNRPFQDSSISLSPRIAKILVNLLGLSKNDTVLDPFCGTGTILIEALLLNHRAIGIEIDSKKVAGSRKNLRWVVEKTDYIKSNRFNVYKGDATNLKLPINSVHGIATEPILLPKMLKYPDEKTARERLREAYDVYKYALRSMKKILKKDGRIAIVSPGIKTRNKKIINFDFIDLIEKEGFRVVKKYENNNPFIITSKDQKIIRNIWLIEHSD